MGDRARRRVAWRRSRGCLLGRRLGRNGSRRSRGRIRIGLRDRSGLRTVRRRLGLRGRHWSANWLRCGARRFDRQPFRRRRGRWRVRGHLDWTCCRGRGCRNGSGYFNDAHLQLLWQRRFGCRNRAQAAPQHGKQDSPYKRGQRPGNRDPRFPFIARIGEVLPHAIHDGPRQENVLLQHDGPPASPALPRHVRLHRRRR